MTDKEKEDFREMWRDKTNEIELPCPFCGSTIWGIFGGSMSVGKFWIECEGDDCGDWFVVAKNKEEAVEKWNKRHGVSK